MSRLTVILLTFVMVFPFSVLSQNTEARGFGVYQKYDRSFITPDLKRKHSVSFGPAAMIYAPRVPDFIVSPGVELGYNYLILNRREIKLSRKMRYREEIKLGFGLRFNLYTENQYSIMASIYRPFMRTKGRFFNWYLFSQYSLGIIKSTVTQENPNPIGLNLSVELIRLRVGKIPLVLHTNFDYAVKNDLLGKDRLNMGFSGGLRYYFYKNKP